VALNGLNSGTILDGFYVVVDEVDFPGFLFFGGMEFEIVGNMDGVVLGPGKRTDDLLSSVVPSSVGNTVGIGVGKQDDFVVTKREKLFDLEFAETTGCEPDVLRIEFREDDGSFFGFYHTHNRRHGCRS